MERPSRAQALAAATLLALLTVVHTWPLASAPQTLSRNDNGDCQLNEWIVSWIAHQLPRDPLHLYEANIFHPEPRTLTFSEPLLVPALLGAPIRWLGGSPVLTYNVLLLVGLWLAGLAGAGVGFAMTGDGMAALLAGSLVAFNAQTLTRLPHLQAQWAFAFAPALFFFDRLLREGQRRDAVGLGVCVALLSVTSGYWAALVAVSLLASLLTRAGEALRAGRRTAVSLACAAAITLALSAPMLFPYWTAHREQGLERRKDEAAAFSSTPSNYLATPARLHSAWSQRFFGQKGGAGFPGVAALLLAALGTAHAWRSAWTRSLLAMALAGVVLSLGPATPAYRLLHVVFPPMKTLRDPSRFVYLVLLAVALLAPLGIVALRKRLSPARGALVAGLLVGIVNAEALCAPFDYVRFDGFSPLYRRVADAPAGTVLAEFPFYPAAEVYRNAEYVLASTQHWKPLVNGYSGFTPPSFARRAEILRRFPDDAAFQELHRLGVTHVAVHFGRLGPARARETADGLAARTDVDLLETGPSGERLYRLRPAS